MLTFALTIVRHGETQYNRDKLLQGQGIDTSLSDTGHEQAAQAGLYLKDLHFSNVFVSNLQRAVQTAEIILRHNIHSSAIEMVLDPLLRERGFGVAEGRPKEDLKNMANAAGQACRDYTPPGGETLDQNTKEDILKNVGNRTAVTLIHFYCMDTKPMQVKMRFKKFLKSFYQRMLDEHSPPNCCSASSSGPSEPECPVIAGLANDGVHGVPVHALIVSHGAFIRISVRHLVDDLQCCLPAGLKMNQVFSPCPNTGISRFIFSLHRAESGPRATHIHCVFINRKDHLDDVK